MKRPQLGNWKIERELDQPEDEFFGLIDDDDLPQVGGGKEPKNQGLSPMDLLRIGGDFFKSIGERKEKQRELEELQEMMQEAPGPRPVNMSDLDAYVQRLDKTMDFEAFREEESQSTLFADIQKTRNKRFRSAAWGLWIAAGLFAWLGWKLGQPYLHTLSEQQFLPESWVLKYLSYKQAKATATVAALLTPLLAFVLSAVAIGQLLGGILERSAARILLAFASGLAVVLALGALGQSLYVGALVAVIVGIAVNRIVEMILVRMGAY